MNLQPADQPAEMIWGSLNALAYVPSTLPGPAMRVLMHLMAIQEPGGRIVITQNELAQEFNVNRSLITIAIQHLQFARLLRTQRRGVYQLNPMVAGYRTPVESLAAIKNMPEDERLDSGDFEERYMQSVHAHNAAKEQKRRSGAKVTDIRRPRLRSVPAGKG
ncbi:hypothetical protein [Streptomyces xiamenensis]|uniref:hypothetical protein n=1 Tax=Streptomyces xiamenensis TaxID=408015 RepID=UPI0035DB482B